MLTRLRIRNFKTLADVDIPLGQNVVLIGPNNSGKTSALQALSLWQAGLREWSSRRSETSQAKLRTGVTINRKALTHTPVADARRLWRDLKVKYSQKTNGSKDTKDIFLDVIVDGETGGKTWSCGFEFYYASTESIYCRPLRLTEDGHDRMDAPQSAVQTRVALLPTMSGLAAEEPELQHEKVSDDFLPPIFKRYFEQIGGDNRLNKSDFYVLADFIEPHEFDPEIVEALDLIVSESRRASPAV